MLINKELKISVCVTLLNNKIIFKSYFYIYLHIYLKKLPLFLFTQVQTNIERNATVEREIVVRRKTLTRESLSNVGVFRGSSGGERGVFPNVPI